MKKEPLILTFDFGTQSVRASIFNKKGETLAMEKKSYEPAYFSPKPGFAEQDPDYYFDCLCSCTQKLVKEHPELIENVIGITQCVFRDSAAMLDQDLKPVRPTILWLDQRFAKCEKKLPLLHRVIYKLIRKDDVIKFNRMRTASNWVIENEPENWAKVAKYVPISTYFAYRLTGELKDAPGNAVGHYPISFHKKKWNKDPLHDIQGQCFSIRKDQLSTLVEEGSVIGTLNEEASKLSGLPVGLPFYATGTDKSCETLGAGVIDSTMAAISLGTASTIETTTTKYTEPGPFLPCYPSCISGYWNMDHQIYRGFWTLNWFMKEFGLAQIKDVALDAPNLENLNKAMMELPAGSDGLVLQPYWGSMLDRPRVKGSIVGFSDSTTRLHVYKALIEGVGYELKTSFDYFQKKVGHPFQEVRISGGGANSDEICQIMADIMGVPVRRAQTVETGSLGAAMAGFIYAKEFASQEEATKAMVHPQKAFLPNLENHQTYEYLLHHVYQKEFPAMKNIYSTLWEFTRR